MACKIAISAVRVTSADQTPQKIKYEMRQMMLVASSLEEKANNERCMF